MELKDTNKIQSEMLNNEDTTANLSSSDRNTEMEREQWSRKADALLSFLGYAVGLGNIWRFPYLCMRNGGGAFLIPFMFFLMCVGLPLYFLELCWGQFSGKSASHAWEVCPLFKGVGIGMVVVLGLTAVYYNMVITWTLFYIGNSFINPLPWGDCGNDWNTHRCISDRTGSVPINSSSVLSANFTSENSSQAVITDSSNLSNSSKLNISEVTSEEEFWQNKMLSMTAGLDIVGNIPWHLAVCSVAAWVLVYLCLMKGVKSIGKVVYVTATLPYILLTILLIRGVTLPGSADGILFYIKPDFSKLSKAQVWIEAALQVFYSLGPAWGPMISMSSYNKFNNNCLRDSIILTLASEGTSVYGGFVIFSILGFMANKANLPISKIVKSGPGLAFIAYPEAIAQMPLPNLWAVLFFLMLLTVGLDSQFVHVESVVTSVLDTYPRLLNRRVYVSAIICAMYCLVGLVTCTQGGIYVFQLMDWYVAALALPLFGLIESIVFAWIYGAERLSQDIRIMLNRGLPAFIRISLCVITPITLLTLLLFTLATYKLPTYGNYTYPGYAYIIGWFLSLIPIIPVPIFGGIVLYHAKGETFFQKLKDSLNPSERWGPNVKEYSKIYTEENRRKERNFYQNIITNLMGSKL